jgi:hypothetical protein
MQYKRKKTASSARSIRSTDASTKDAGKVSLGGWNPRLPRVRPASGEVEDAGKVRLGGWNPKL